MIAARVRGVVFCVNFQNRRVGVRLVSTRVNNADDDCAVPRQATWSVKRDVSRKKKKKKKKKIKIF
jgi:hypothetical protein